MLVNGGKQILLVYFIVSILYLTYITFCYWFLFEYIISVWCDGRRGGAVPILSFFVWNWKFSFL